MILYPTKRITVTMSKGLQTTSANCRYARPRSRQTLDKLKDACGLLGTYLRLVRVAPFFY